MLLSLILTASVGVAWRVGKYIDRLLFSDKFLGRSLRGRARSNIMIRTYNNAFSANAVLLVIKFTKMYQVEHTHF